MSITLTEVQELVHRAGALQQELDEMGFRRTQKARRGTSNGNASGSSEDRRRRRAWLVETYRADVIVVTANEFGATYTAPVSAARVYGDDAQIACRCYRCGKVLTVETVTVDRIIPGCQGGTYRRNNIRPACSECNEKTGGSVRRFGAAEVPAQVRGVSARRPEGRTPPPAEAPAVGCDRAVRHAPQAEDEGPWQPHLTRRTAIRPARAGRSSLPTTTSEQGTFVTNGPAPSADGPGSGSSTTPTDGPPNDKLSIPLGGPSVTFPMTADSLTGTLQRMYRTGWEMARALPGLEAPPPIEFRVEIDHDNKQVNVTAIVT